MFGHKDTEMGRKRRRKLHIASETLKLLKSEQFAKSGYNYVSSGHNRSVKRA